MQCRKHFLSILAMIKEGVTKKYIVLGVILLLLVLAFLENNDGDYRRAIKVAKDRLKWLHS